MSARELAAKVQPGSVVRWDRLEREAFAGHPAVTKALQAAKAPRAAKPRWQTIAVIPVGIAMAFFMLTPILGVAAISRNRFQDYTAPAEDMIPLAGTFYALALVWMLGWMVLWFVKNRRYSGLPATFAGMTLVLGLLTALALADRGEDEAVPGWELWMIPVVGSVVAAVVFLVALIVAKARGSREQDTNAKQSGTPENKVQLLEFRREAVASLSEGERQAITRDLHAAILDLEKRGLISAAEAERARATSLGGLALRM